MAGSEETEEVRTGIMGRSPTGLGTPPHLLAGAGTGRSFAGQGHTVALQDLLHMPHHSLVAEPEVQL